MEGEGRPANDWRADLRQKSNEDLLSLLHDVVGDDPNEDCSEEIRSIYLERKVDFNSGPAVPGPPGTKVKQNTRATILVIGLNIVVLGPLAALAIGLITWMVEVRWGASIGLIPELPIACLIVLPAGAGINALLFFIARDYPSLRKFASGFAAGIAWWMIGAPVLGTLIYVLLFIIAACYG